jgi:O-antigen/teichoic acid export membrane protein
MKPNTIRGQLIALLAAAAVLSVVGNKTHSTILGWLAFACFFVAVLLYFRWRRSLHNVRKRNETRSGSDQ